MTILKVSYSELTTASKKSRQAANELNGYASALERGVAKKISNLTSSNYLENALDLTNKKVQAIKDKSSRLEDFANRIEEFKNTVQETDKAVATKINNIAGEFKSNNNIEIGPVSRFFQWLSTDVLNSTSFGRWVKDVFKDGMEIFDDIKTNINHWYRACGGKYIVEAIAKGAVAVIAAIATLAAASCLVVVIAAAIALAFALVNTGVDVYESFRAYNETKNNDPGWGKRHSKLDKLSDVLKSKGHDKIAAALDVTETVTDMISIGDSFFTMGKKFITGQKYTTAVANFLGNKNEGVIGKFFSKKVGADGYDLKIIDGLKSVFTGSGSAFRSQLANGFKNDLKYDIGYIKSKGGIIKKEAGYIKDMFTKPGVDARKAGHFLWNDVKGGITNGMTNLKSTTFDYFKKGYDEVNSMNSGKNFFTKNLPQSVINAIKIDSKIDFAIKAFGKITDPIGSEELIFGKTKKFGEDIVKSWNGGKTVFGCN